MLNEIVVENTEMDTHCFPKIIPLTSVRLKPGNHINKIRDLLALFFQIPPELDGSGTDSRRAT